MALPRNISPGEGKLPVKQLAVEDLARGASLWRNAMRRLMANRLALFSLSVLVFLAVLFLLGPIFWPYDPNIPPAGFGAEPPSLHHPFGKDMQGRDLLSRVMSGGRLSLAVGMAATVVSLLIGVTWGAISGYAGGKTDAVMMRTVDILYAMPFTVFVILLMTVVPRETWVDNTRFFRAMGLSTNLLIMFMAIGAVEWLTMARIVRGQVMGLKQQEFVDAAISLGLRPWRIIRRHVIPNILGPVIVYATLTVPAVMLLEAFISFLGLGVQPPQASWGLLIREGADNMTVFPWLLLIPAFFFSLTLFCLNFLGDGLRDALDPRSGRE